MDPSKTKEVGKEFVEAIYDADAVLYVALTKSPDGKLTSNTGGYKEGTKLTVNEMSHGVGTILGELILQMKIAMGEKAKGVSNDELLTVLSPSLIQGARSRLGIKTSGGNGA
jgi:hypothetical protein